MSCIARTSVGFHTRAPQQGRQHGLGAAGTHVLNPWRSRSCFSSLVPRATSSPTHARASTASAAPTRAGRSGQPAPGSSGCIESSETSNSAPGPSSPDVSRRNVAATYLMDAFGAYSDSEEDAGEETEAPKPLALQVREHAGECAGWLTRGSARYVPRGGGRLLA